MYLFIEKIKIKILRQPGIEPGSIAWKATMLTFTPPTLQDTRTKFGYSFLEMVEFICTILDLEKQHFPSAGNNDLLFAKRVHHFILYVFMKTITTLTRDQPVHRGPIPELKNRNFT